MKNLNWEIEQTPIYNAEGRIIKGYKEIRREGDVSKLLSVMKNSYTPLTIEKFKGIVNTISKESSMRLENYQEYKGGKVITAQLKSNKPFHIKGSTIEGYLTIGTGYDGSQSFFIGHTNEYLRCTNQFGRIFKKHVQRLTKNSSLYIDNILKDILEYNAFEEELYDSFNQMQKVKIDEQVVKLCIERLAELTYEEKLDNRLISSQTAHKMLSLKDTILSECKDLGDNVFGLFNGITKYTTHVMKTHEKDVFGNLFTAKGKINEKGYNFSKELIYA